MWSMRIGNVSGIPIKLHLSWLILAGLSIYSFEQLFTLNGQSGLPLALLGTLLLLCSIVLHEVGHALMARRLGLRVTAITLFLTGGLTELADDVDLPQSEFKIALIGPLVNVGLAIAAFVGAWFSQGVWASFWATLAIINGLLAVFNLLPCHPLDGGRVLRSIFWFLNDDLLRGTLQASMIGRYLGNGLMIIGLVALFSNALTGSLLLLMGWMTNRAAVSNFVQTTLNYTLSRALVGEVMTRSFRTVSPHLTLDLFAGQYLLGQAEPAFPVVHSERLIGMISVQHLYRYAMGEWRSISVGDAMTPKADLPRLNVGDSMQTAYYTMLGQRYDSLPVTDGDAVVGIVRHRDVVAFVQSALKIKV